MYSKISEQIDYVAIGIKVAGMSRQEMNDFLSTVSPEDVKEALKVLRNPKEKLAGAKTRGAITLLNILGVLLGTALAGLPARDQAADELEKLHNKGKVTVERITDFKADLPKETLEFDQKAVDNLNNLIEKAKDAEIPESFSGTPLEVGGEKLIPRSKEDAVALKALVDMVNSLAEAKHKSPGLYKAKVKILVDAFKKKRLVKFS